MFRTYLTPQDTCSYFLKLIYDGKINDIQSLKLFNIKDLNYKWYMKSKVTAKTLKKKEFNSVL